jgi:hypothetical protein
LWPFENAIPVLPHPEERPQGASRMMQNIFAAIA